MALQVTSLEEWINLLTSGGIPSAAAETYAAKFVENRLTHLDLPDLDKTILTSLDITSLEDLHLAKRSPNTVASQQADIPSNEQSPRGYKNSSASASVKLPTVTSNMAPPQFWKFRVDWDVYTTITGLPTQERTAHLYSACDPTVQHSIINTKPNFLTFIRNDAIDTIESLVTKQSNPIVV